MRADNHFVSNQCDFLCAVKPFKESLAKFEDIPFQNGDLLHYSGESASSRARKTDAHLIATGLNDLIGWSENSLATRAGASTSANV
jgi:hypothetical protein